jgi:hypothetical protein
METVQQKKILMLIALILVLLLIVTWLRRGASESDGGMVQLDMSRGGVVVTQQMSEAESKDEPVNTVSDQTEGDPGELDFVATLKEFGYNDLELGFEHTAPGEYSEVIVRHHGEPGDELTITVFGTHGSDYRNSRVVTADENGEVVQRFKVSKYGLYQVEVQSQLKDFTDGAMIRVE